MTFLLIAAGLVLLVLGAEWLVGGAARLAGAVGISPLVIGLTVVAFGTSTPELAVSVDAARSGDAGIALGNVIGSNIFNVWVILGLAALVAPLRVGLRMVRVEVPVMLAVSVLLFGLAWDGLLGRLDGLVLLAGLGAYLGYMVRSSRTVQEANAGGASHPAAPAPSPARRLGDVARLAAGLALLVVGSGWFVEGARRLADALGVPELVVGLTVVAAGTSLPELATSVVAAARGERDIAVGNVVGSNVFNILAILGVTTLVPRGGVAVEAAARTVDLPVMVAAAVLCLPVFLSEGRISRGEGALFLALYVGYATFLGLSAVGHPQRLGWGAVLLGVGLLATLGVVALGFLRRGPAAS